VSDVGLFFAILGIFYLLEGLWWAPREAVSFSRGLFGAFTSATPILLRRDSRSGSILPRHLVARGERFLCCGWPVLVSPRGFGSLQDDPAPRQIRYEDTGALSASGRRLLYGGRTFARTASAGAARELLRWLRDLSGEEPHRRAEKIVQVIDRKLDRATARRRVRGMRWIGRRSGWLPLALFANLFVVAPGLLSFFGGWTWPVGASLHLMLSAIAALVFSRTDKILYPDRRDDRFSQVLTILLFPPAALRYADLLSRDLLGDLHPLAVAAALDRKTLTELARNAVVDSRRRFPNETEDAAWFRRTCEERVLLALKRYGLDPRALEEAPQPEAGAAAYCPRCHAQYRSGIEDCVDCEGMALMAHRAG
jgi:hypothetical protein